MAQYIASLKMSAFVYLYVFDLAPNKKDFSDRDWEAFDPENWKYKDGSNFAE